MKPHINITSILKALISILFLIESITTASAVPRISSMTAIGPGVESFSYWDTVNVQGPLGYSGVVDHLLYLSETLTKVNPSILSFNVSHYDPVIPWFAGDGLTIDLSITNETGTLLSSLEWEIVNASFSSPVNPLKFSFDFPEPLGVGDTFHGVSDMLLYDPAPGDSYTFTVIQTPTAIPEPQTYAMLMMDWLYLYLSVAERASAERSYINFID